MSEYCAALIAVFGSLVLSSTAFALSPFSDDFESYTVDSTFAPWIVFSDNAGMGNYVVNPASSNGPQISALVEFEGNQFLNFFANYDNNPVHMAGSGLREAISFYREMTFTGAEAATGATWTFSWDYGGNPDFPVTGDTQVGAFIRVFDGTFNLLDEQTFDTLDISGGVQSGQLSQALNPDWVEGGILQVGFFNVTGEGNGSGRFYDNVNFVPVPAAVWLMLSGLGALVGFRRKFA